MKKQPVYVTRHDLSSLFEKSLTLIGPTWKASLPAVAIIYAPIAALTALFFVYYFQYIGSIGEFTNAEQPAEFLVKSLGFMGITLLYSVVSSIGGSIAECLVSRNAFMAATGERASWTKLMREIALGKFGKIFLLNLLQGLVVVGLVVALAVVVSVGIILIALEGAAAIIGGIITIIGVLVGYLAIFMARYLLTVAFPVLANEELGAGGAFSRTFKLLKGNAWRVFGVSVLFSIALSLGVTMVCTPLSIAVIIPFIANLQDFAGAMSGEVEQVYQAMADIGRSVLLPLTIIIAVAGVITYCIAPLFRTLLYIDLRVRSGDLPDTAQFSELGAETPPPQA